jgi:YhcH/YjgK/YiaL family protein
MIYGKLSDFESLNPGLLSSALELSIKWLRELPEHPNDGRYELDPISGLYAMVMSYDTVEPEQSRFESHQRFVDLQYTISGAEVIEWAHSGDLNQDGEYLIESDLQFYHSRIPFARVNNLPGFFSVYCPSDAHRPKIRLGNYTHVRKVVVKIPVSAF